MHKQLLQVIYGCENAEQVRLALRLAGYVVKYDVQVFTGDHSRQIATLYHSGIILSDGQWLSYAIIPARLSQMGG